MKRISILLMVLGLVAGSMATAQAKSPTASGPKRTVVKPYGPYPSPVTGCNEVMGPWACAVIPTRDSEGLFTAKLTDAHGLPVYFDVAAFSEYGGSEDLGTFCGETTKPIRFQPGSDLVFHVGLPGWPETNTATACPGNNIKTTGTISVTLSRDPLPREYDPVVGPTPPLRSGTIHTGTGWLADSALGGCQVSPECAVWLYTGCDVDANWSQRDSGFTASIVEIDDLADGPPVEREFRFGAGDPWTPVYGGVQLQFWSSDCVEVPDTRWRSTDCDGTGGNCRRTRLLIPPSAKWMTVTSYTDNVQLNWTLN